MLHELGAYIPTRELHRQPGMLVHTSGTQGAEAGGLS